MAELTCLWYGSFGPRTVRVIWVRHLDSDKSFDLALVTTDLDTPAEDLVVRYSWRWSIEQAFLESRHLLGVGQARNRTEAAVARTLPLGLIAYSLVIVWYARHGHSPDVVAETAAAPPGTAPRPSPASTTCSPCSAARSSPPDFPRPSSPSPIPQKSASTS
ncbi:hypothetical protein ITP53_50100 [Nonomuraea sp. K274]|uniref:Transposase IS4-like domain-containing protein n=1 Tax=Nonomuraea cypriaca TaxID=1187855 RepID=A0A931F719_9ACTN|nr:hypothetical protein [Nonomuraea cypriaca]MBF8193701.1 hypothetical protein [Nonomuraea cypriaca]